MKRIYLTLLVLLMVSAVVCFADTEEAVNTAIDNSAWTAIALDGSTPCKSYSFRSRGGYSFMWRKTATSTTYFTFDGTDKPTITFNREKQPTTLFYAQSSVASDTIEVFVYNDN